MSGVEVPEAISRLTPRRASLSKRARKDEDNDQMSRVEMAKEQFEKAARAGCELGLRWLETLEKEKKQWERLEEEEKQLLTQ